MRIRTILGNTVLWIFLLAFAFITLIPVVITVLGSFKTNAELTTGATFLPSSWHFSNYAEAWQQANFSKYTLNSLIISLSAVVGTLLVSSMAAYVVDRMDFFGKKYISACNPSPCSWPWGRWCCVRNSI